MEWPDTESVGSLAESASREVEKIAASKTFRSAAAQRNFLRYAVTETLQGRAHLLKEYSIGVAVFHKADSFDPRLDSIVRTEARKLRARLAKYFETEGQTDPLRIDFPKGKYSPVFLPNVGSVEAAEAEIVHAHGLAPVPEGYLSASSRVNFQHRHALRIAVLPFMNRSPSKADELFSDGLTDELTHAFTRVPGLEVVARTSAFQFKGHATDIREVGQKLNVQAIVEGSVRRSGNQVRILAQLDDARSRSTVWSETYDRKLADLFAVQCEIANTITGELGTHFTSARALGHLPPSIDSLVRMDLEVYEEYLRGQYFWNRHTIEDFEAAIGCFQQTIAKESRYARAYASLAYCYVMLPILKAKLPSEFMPKVRVAAAKALEIDSSAGEAHIALALPHIHDCDWAAAGGEFRKGLALCPSSAIGHAWYGTYLVNLGRGDEGLREHRGCLDLDPVSASALFCYAQTLYLLRRYDESIDGFRKAVALNPSFPREHAGLGLACIRKGSYVRGIAELELAQSLTHGLGRVKADLAYAYAVSGQRDRAVEILNELLAQFTPRAFPAAMIAEVYIGLRERDLAFDWLHRAIDQKDLAVFLKSDPLYDPLRSDLRFRTLLKRMNLA
jgi:TolB-like protein/Flp pilus assembly protein TadD